FPDISLKIQYGILVAAKRLCGKWIGSRCASESQVDSVGIKRRKGSELFGHYERGMVWQHDPARSDADGSGFGRNVSDKNRSRGRRYAFHVVMFGEPVSGIP